MRRTANPGRTRVPCLLALCLLVPGCVTTGPWLGSGESAGVSQVATTWEGRIHVTQDTVNGGRPLPGLAGRLYLFGPDLGFTQKGSGTVTVDLYDTSNPQVPPKHLDRFAFDPATLDKLLRKDKIGWGYTLFLPLPMYRPDITHVRLNACYSPPQGSPLYAEPASISLRNQANLTQTRHVAGQ